MKFGELRKFSRPDLVVSARHDKWLQENPNPVYTNKALAFGLQALTDQAHQRDRSGSFSASGLNKCVRQQQFTFLGMPELPPSPKTAQIFHNGTFMHIRWQMAGLSEGWMEEAEVPVPQNPLALKGTMDGVTDDERVVELKSCNSNAFRGVMTYGAKDDHVSQLATYCEATGMDRGLFIYENKDTQEYTEIPYIHTPERSAMVKDRAEWVWDHVARQQLAPVLDKCIAQEGYQYNGCPYRDRCLKIKTWEEASHARG